MKIPKQFYPVMALAVSTSKYMPYPLISEKAPPTPHEVFGKWLDASEHLPRVDMVVASAAGSIFDLHTEAGASGIGATKLQEMVRLGQLAESDPEASDDKSDSSDSSDVSESSYRNFMEYYESIDVSNEYDKYATEHPKNIVVVDPTIKSKFTHVSLPDPETGKVLSAEPTFLASALTTIKDQVDEKSLASPPIFGSFEEEEEDEDEEVANASGDLKEPRREELAGNYAKLEAHFEQYKDQYYHQRKRQLLEKLHQLQSSEIYFDNRKNKINNDELRRYVEMRKDRMTNSS
ncbi:hypothetical protein JCM33374_g6325 [Metschnikowia sp. JCM 33374]|nr:hypothetical protein JCM33374_g6325 [Metschnikowia sp. JCM 33374]